MGTSYKGCVLKTKRQRDNTKVPTGKSNTSCALKQNAQKRLLRNEPHHLKNTVHSHYTIKKKKKKERKKKKRLASVASNSDVKSCIINTRTIVMKGSAIVMLKLVLQILEQTILHTLSFNS